MRHLTNYYKNLAEQLQLEVYRLTKILQESHPSTRADRRRAASKAKKHPHKDFKGDGGKRREFERLSGKPVPKSERRDDDDLNENTNSKKPKDSHKKNNNDKFMKILDARAKATHCPMCGDELWNKGGALQTGLCHMCASERGN